jgi:hypothetical protein
MRKFLWLPVAGFLLIAGAAVATAAQTALPRAQAVIPAADATASPDASAAPGPLGKPLFHDDADLVAKGTITQAQADAITNGITTEIEARRAEMEALRQQWQETRQQIQTFLEDGVITQAEIDTLPADNPLRTAFDSIAKDGQITLDQLRDFLPFDGHGMGGPMGPSFGHHGFGGWPGMPDTTDQDPSATPTP